MARYASFALIALFFVIPYAYASEEAVADVLGAEDAKVLEERSPGYPLDYKGPAYPPKMPQPYKAAYKPLTQPEPHPTGNLGALYITPAIALIHACWDPYPKHLGVISAAILEGLEVVGLKLEDLSYAKVLVAGITVVVKSDYSTNKYEKYGGDSYKAPAKKEEVIIVVAEVERILRQKLGYSAGDYGSGLSALSSSLANLVWTQKDNYQDVLCLDIVVQLRILEAKSSYPPPQVYPKPQKYPEPSYPEPEYYPKPQKYPEPSYPEPEYTEPY